MNSFQISVWKISKRQIRLHFRSWSSQHTRWALCGRVPSYVSSRVARLTRGRKTSCPCGPHSRRMLGVVTVLPHGENPGSAQKEP